MPADWPTLESTWLRLVEGTDRRPLTNLARALLWIAQLPYACAMLARNRLYDGIPGLAGAVPVPVISVGNLTVGGTGKTPLVRWLARWLHAREHQVAVLSRGYRAVSGTWNDEALELELLLPHVIQVAQRDRLAAARRVIAERNADVIILDDGFQHRRVARDLNILTVDALFPFGRSTDRELLLPRGLLRESVNESRRATTIVLCRSDAISPQQKQRIRSRLLRVAPRAVWVEAVEKPLGWMRLDGSQATLEILRGHAVFAFCGIGNPQGFAHSLKHAGVHPVELMRFPDHARFDATQLAELRRRFQRQASALPIVCTLKDLVKLKPHYREHPLLQGETQDDPRRIKPPNSRGEGPIAESAVYALRTEIELVLGESELVRQLEACSMLAPRSHPRQPVG